MKVVFTLALLMLSTSGMMAFEHKPAQEWLGLEGFLPLDFHPGELDVKWPDKPLDRSGSRASSDILMSGVPDIYFTGSWFPGTAITRFSTSVSGGYVYLIAHTSGGAERDIILTSRTDVWFSPFNPGVPIVGFTQEVSGGYLFLTAHAQNGTDSDIMMTNCPSIWASDFNPGEPIVGFDSEVSGGYLFLEASSQANTPTPTRTYTPIPTYTPTPVPTYTPPPTSTSSPPPPPTSTSPPPTFTPPPYPTNTPPPQPTNTSPPQPTNTSPPQPTNTPQGTPNPVSAWSQGTEYNIVNLCGENETGIHQFVSYQDIPFKNHETMHWYNLNNTGWNNSDWQFRGSCSGTYSYDFPITLEAGDNLDVFTHVRSWDGDNWHYYSGGSWTIPVKPVLDNDLNPCGSQQCFSRPTDYHGSSQVAVIGSLSSKSGLFPLLAKERWGIEPSGQYYGKRYNIDVYADFTTSEYTVTKFYDFDEVGAIMFMLHYKPIEDFINNQTVKDTYDYVFLSTFLKTGDYVDHPVPETASTLASTNFARNILDGRVDYSDVDNNGIRAAIYTFYDSPLTNNFQILSVSLGHWNDDKDVLWGGNQECISANQAVVSSIDSLIFGGVDAAGQAAQNGVDPQDAYAMYQLISMHNGGEPQNSMQAFNIRKEWKMTNYQGATLTQPVVGGSGTTAMGLLTIVNYVLRFALALEARNQMEGIALKQEAYENYKLIVQYVNPGETPDTVNGYSFFQYGLRANSSDGVTSGVFIQDISGKNSISFSSGATESTVVGFTHFTDGYGTYLTSWYENGTDRDIIWLHGPSVVSFNNFNPGYPIVRFEARTSGSEVYLYAVAGNGDEDWIIRSTESTRVGLWTFNP